MIRNLKALGLALVAMGALASSASADIFRFESAPIILTGSQASEHVITMNTGTAVKCKTASFTGTSPVTEATTITTDATYSECIFGSNPATITMNGCDWSITSHTNATGHSEVHLICPAGKVIQIDVPAISCVLDIAAQTPQGGVKYTNEGVGATRDLLAHVTILSLKVTPTGGFLCNLNTSANYTGTTTYTGETESGNVHIGVWLEDTF